MELPDVKKIEMQDLNRWFTTLVDAINYDFQEVSKLVAGLQPNITTIDTVPIQYLKKALDDMVDNLNKNFTGIKTEFDKMEERIKSLEDSQTGA